MLGNKTIVKVKFKDLGRDNANFTTKETTWKEVTEGNFLYNHAKAHLMSNDIDFMVEKENQFAGRVVVGGFRTVGEFEVIIVEEVDNG